MGTRPFRFPGRLHDRCLASQAFNQWEFAPRELATLDLLSPLTDTRMETRFLSGFTMEGEEVAKSLLEETQPCLYIWRYFPPEYYILSLPSSPHTPNSFSVTGSGKTISPLSPPAYLLVLLCPSCMVSTLESHPRSTEYARQDWV